MSGDGYIRVANPYELTSDPEAMAAEDALYPELALHGQLAGAIQAAAADLALDLGTVASDDNPRRGALVARSVSGPGDVPMGIGIGAVERWFLIDGLLQREEWVQGVQWVRGATPDLREVVRAAAAWRRGASLAEIQQAAPFVARGYQTDPADAAAQNWSALRVTWSEDYRLPFVADLIEAAYAVPQLRLLIPYTSHFNLCLHTSTGHRCSEDIQIEPRGDAYHVYGLHECDGYVLRNGFEGDVIGEADDAQSAITLLLAHLPANVGPAVAGTADDT